MPEMRWPHPPQLGLIHLLAALAHALHHILHIAGVPGQQDVREKCVCAGNHMHLLLPMTSMDRNFLGVDRPLQVTDRFAARQQRVQFAPEVPDGDVVAQKDAAEQPSQMSGRLASRVGFACRAQPPQSQRSADPPGANRRDKPLALVPALADCAERHAMQRHTTR